MDRLPTEAIQTAAPELAGGVAVHAPRSALNRAAKVASSTAPWLIIAGLLWAGLFIKPQSAGSTVTPSVLERRDFFYGMAVPAPDVLWLAGSNGKIVRSEDGGRNWQLQAIPTKVNFQDIAAWDAQHAVAVGNQGVVATTADAGRNWKLAEAPKSSVANKLTRVVALAQGQAWAVGEMGALLHSGDFGNTWQRKRAEEDVGWNDVAFADANTGWVVGEFGRILRTRDGGATWLAVEAPVKSSLMGVAFRDASNGVAVGLEGVVLATGDAGVTWQAVKSGTAEHLFTVAWDARKSAWIAGGNQGVWVSGSADAASWQAGRLAQRDLSWHTKAVVAADKVYFTGANVGAWDGKSWQVVTGGARLPVAEENLPGLGRRGQTPAAGQE
jgi:photosystem II stability/assembly factor-like uncharacterized protein